MVRDGCWLMAIRKIVTVLASVGIALHFFSIVSDLNFSDTPSYEPENDFDDSLFVTLLFFIVPLAPYIICLLISKKVANSALVLPAVVGVLAMDVDTYFAVKASASSTAAISLVVAPILNLIVIIPMGVLIGWLLTRFGPFKTPKQDA